MPRFPLATETSARISWFHSMLAEERSYTYPGSVSMKDMHMRNVNT